MNRLLTRDLMNREVLAARADMTVGELATFLLENEISGAPVADRDGRLVGVVSLRDIVAYVTAEDDDDGDEAAGHPDYFARGWEEDEWSEEEIEELDLAGEDLLVEDIMTPRVFSVSEDASVPAIASLMLKEHLHRLLVIRDGRPLGIISTSDLLGLLVEEA